MLHPLLVLLLIFALGIAAAALVDGSPRRSALGMAVVTPALALPLLARGSHPLVLALLSLTSLAGAMRIWDLVRMKEPRSLGWRLVFLFAFLDLRLMRPVRPPGVGRLLAEGVAFLALATGAATAVMATLDLPDGPGAFALRTLAAGVFFYCLLDGGDRLMRAGWGAAGMTMPRLQHTPIAARTLSEFWGRRWNAEVHRWVARHVFRPAAAGGAALGLAAAFAYSAALHLVPTLIATDLPNAALMAAFFLAHGALMAAEHALHVNRWPPAPARAWTVGWFLVTLPLFTEPCIAIFGW